MATTIRLCHITLTVGTDDSWYPYGDTSWKWRWISLWSQIEVDVGIVAASLPSLSPLLKQVWSGFANTRSLSPSRIPSIVETGFKSPGTDIEELQKLPSTITLPSRTASVFDRPNSVKRLASFDGLCDSEDGIVSHEAFPGPYDETQIGVARTVDTRLSRATFVTMPASPRRDGFWPFSEVPDTQ